MKTCWRGVLLAGLVALAGAVMWRDTAAAKEKGGSGAEQGGKKNIELYVSTRWLPLHERPKGFSPVKTLLSFGAPVQLKGMARADGETSSMEKGDTWAFIESGGKQGYAPVASLVSADVLQRQDPSSAMRRVEARDVTASGKGFSESEDGDLKAMKGVAGKAGSGVADDAAIDAILAAPQEYDPRTAYESFRKEGMLGEFQEKW